MIDEQEGAWQSLQRRAHDVETSPRFEKFVLSTIGLYGMMIGVEQSLRTSEHYMLELVMIMESVFLILFLGEMIIRIVAHGINASLRDRAFLFDLFLLSTGIFYHWGVRGIFQEDDDIAIFMMLRLVRVLRVGRSLALCRHNREFHLITRSFLNSAHLTSFIFAMLLLILYIYAAIGVEVIGFSSANDESPEFREIASKHFSSIPAALMTLLQFVCRDGMAALYWPLIEQKPGLGLYFVSLIFTVSIVLMCVVNAVVANATFKGDQDLVDHVAEKNWSVLMSDLRRLFADLDRDRSGHLTKDEMRNLDPDIKKRLCAAVCCDNPADFFDAYDKDKSGKVSINEFFDGVMQSILANTPLTLTRVEKQIESMNWRLGVVFEQVFDMYRTLSVYRPQDTPPLSVRATGLSSWSAEPPVSGMQAELLKDLQNLHARCTAEDGHSPKSCSVGAVDNVAARFQVDTMELDSLPQCNEQGDSTALMNGAENAAIRPRRPFRPARGRAGGAAPVGPASLPDAPLPDAGGLAPAGPAPFSSERGGPASAGSSSPPPRARKRGRTTALRPGASGQSERSRRPSRPRRQPLRDGSASLPAAPFA